MENKNYQNAGDARPEFLYKQPSAKAIDDFVLDEGLVLSAFDDDPLLQQVEDQNKRGYLQ